MNRSFVVARDRRDPGTVRITGRLSRACQADLASALSGEAHGMRRLDLTGLEALSAAAIEVLLVLAEEIDLELLVTAGHTVTRQVLTSGLDDLARVSPVDHPEQWVARSA